LEFHQIKHFVVILVFVHDPGKSPPIYKGKHHADTT